MAKTSSISFLFAKYKYIIIAIAIVILIVVTYLLATRSEEKKEVKIKNQDLIDNANAEIDTTKITQTDMQFNTLASKLYMAMKGWGTDEDAIFNVFKALQSRSDVLQLSKVFGVRDGKTLEEYLYFDLDQEDIDKINNILASKAINYTF